MKVSEFQWKSSIESRLLRTISSISLVIRWWPVIRRALAGELSSCFPVWRFDGIRSESQMKSTDSELLAIRHVQGPRSPFSPAAFADRFSNWENEKVFPKSSWKITRIILRLADLFASPSVWRRIWVSRPDSSDLVWKRMESELFLSLVLLSVLSADNLTRSQLGTLKQFASATLLVGTFWSSFICRWMVSSEWYPMNRIQWIVSDCKRTLS